MWHKSKISFTSQIIKLCTKLWYILDWNCEQDLNVVENVLLRWTDLVKYSTIDIKWNYSNSLFSRGTFTTSLHCWQLSYTRDSSCAHIWSQCNGATSSSFCPYLVTARHGKKPLLLLQVMPIHGHGKKPVTFCYTKHMFPWHIYFSFFFHINFGMKPLDW